MHQNPMAPAPARASGQVSRRTLAKGATWSMPAIALATAAPPVCASAPLCQFRTEFTANATSGTKSLATTRISGSGTSTYTVEFSSSMTSGFSSPYNMTIGNTAYYGNSTGTGCTNQIAGGTMQFGTIGLVLNQYGGSSQMRV